MRSGRSGPIDETGLMLTHGVVMTRVMDAIKLINESGGNNESPKMGRAISDAIKSVILFAEKNKDELTSADNQKIASLNQSLVQIITDKEKLLSQHEQHVDKLHNEIKKSRADIINLTQDITREGGGYDLDKKKEAKKILNKAMIVVRHLDLGNQDGKQVLDNSDKLSHRMEAFLNTYSSLYRESMVGINNDAAPRDEQKETKDDVLKDLHKIRDALLSLDGALYSFNDKSEYFFKFEISEFNREVASFKKKLDIGFELHFEGQDEEVGRSLFKERKEEASARQPTTILGLFNHAKHPVATPSTERPDSASPSSSESPDSPESPSSSVAARGGRK